MIRNYFKTAWRYLVRYKTYSAINILGLAVGITCCILIMLFVRTEFSYDRFHAKADRIYRVWQKEKVSGQEFTNVFTPIPMGPAIKSSFPEVDAVCRVISFNTLVSIGDNAFNENIIMVDSTLFTMFDFQLLQGTQNQPFPTANSVVITPEIAKKYFGTENATGKTFQMQLDDVQQLVTVAGIVKKAPEESSIKYGILLPYANVKQLYGERMMQTWFNIFTETYVLLKAGVHAASLEQKFPAMLKQQLGKNYSPGAFDMYLQPLTAIHLDNSLPEGIQPISSPKYAYILGTIGIALLLVACINFITLSIGRSTTRATEVGVRKALGAARRQLIRQFWGEALLITALSVLLGVLGAALLLKPFNQLINRDIAFSVDAVFILYCLLLTGAIALIAGIYPAIILSGFNPVEVLKGKLNLKNDAGFLRKALIVGQFAASIIMIICTMVIGRQIQYLQGKNLGYNKEQVIIIPTNQYRAEGYPLAKLYKSELTKYPEVISAGAAAFSFAETPWASLGYTDNNKQFQSFRYNEVDASFLQTMQIEIAQGRGFSPENTADSNNSIVVNEAFVKAYGIKDPVGKKFGKYSQQIIGVMKDFNYQSLHTAVEPLVLSLKFDTIARQSSDVSFAHSPKPRISVRMKKGDIQNNIAVLKKAWQAVAPNQEFEYLFLDEKLAALYEQEQKSAAVVKIASGISIFIACMGLFGLSTLTVTRRTKEIGIRKVLGANVAQIVQLLSREFILLVIVAALVAFPVAFWAMRTWLADFAYRTEISWWIFVLAIVVSVAIAFLTISTQAIKAALSNPVKSLRTE